MHLANAMSLGQRLRHERRRLNWSQERLAEAVGTTVMSIHRWEHDQAIPQARYRERLCQVFNTGTDALFRASPDETVLAGAHPLIWHVPALRNPFFTGREAVLGHLHQALHSGTMASITQAQAISGLGGVGKTQIALEYAYRFRENYQAVLWARADTRQGLMADFVTFAALLQLPGAGEADQHCSIEAVKRWLNEQAGWLLILDNVEDLELLYEVLPSAGTGHLLLTTRAQATGTLAQNFELEQMEPEEGALFLLRRAKRIAPGGLLEDAPEALRTQALAISAVMDGLPLALDQAGAYLEETACDLLSYLDHYQARRACLLARRGERAADHPDSVTTTFSLAIEQVEQANPAAADLLRLCTFLHPDVIPEALITDGADELGPILQSTGHDAFALDEAIKELRRFSLLRRNPDTQTLSIHRLVQAVVKDALSQGAQRQWAERAVRMVSLTFPDGGEATWPRCQRYLPHAQICATYIQQWTMSFPEAARLLHRTGYYLCERAQYTQAGLFLKSALALREQILGGEHPKVAKSLTALGLLNYLQSNYAQAEQLFQRALTIRERALGPEHSLVAESLNDLATIYFYLGNYAQAKPLYQRALLIYEKTLGPGHPELAHCLCNLAELYRECGNYAQAEQLYQRALAIREQTLGPEHCMLAENVHNLANHYRECGNYAQAEQLYQRALAIRERALGPEHPQFAQSLNALAKLYYNRGEYMRAEQLFQRALLIYEKVLGPEHTRVAVCLNYLADLYHAQGQSSRAEPLSRRALAIRSHSLNPEHPHVAQCLNTLAKVAHAQGQYDQAHTLFRQALAIREKGFDPGHPAVAETLTALGQLYCTQGEYTQAEPLYQRALHIQEHSLGAEHPDLAETLAALGELYSAQGKYAQAEPLYQRALAIWQKASVLVELRHFPALHQYVRARSETTQSSGLLHPEPEVQEVNGVPASAPPDAISAPVLTSKRRLTVQALGEPTVLLDERPITRWRMPRAMELFFFLLDAARPIRKEQLIAALWPEAHDHLDQTVRSTFYYLRQALGESCLVYEAGTYALNLVSLYGSQVWYDVDVFGQRYHLAKQSLGAKDDQAAREALLAMVDLYRGDYVQSFYSDWCTFRRGELQRTYLDARYQLAQIAWRHDQVEESLTHYQQMLAIDKCLEEAHYGIMRCYLHLGKRGLALRQYHLCRDALQSELAVRPGPALQQLYKSLVAASSS